MAIDDTDNRQSRGTGFLARRLAERLEQEGLAVIEGVTRHQLFVDDLIPYTSHNSAACIMAEGSELSKIIQRCRNIVSSDSAEGSDPGLCVVPVSEVDDDITNWGYRAKTEVLKMDDAFALAEKKGIYLEGLGGTRGGVIGSLAAVGLNKAGNDGRFLWVKGMRKYMGVMRIREILEETGVVEIRCEKGMLDDPNLRILLPEWWRPLLKDHKQVLIVEPTHHHLYEYQLITKDHLKRLSC